MQRHDDRHVARAHEAAQHVQKLDLVVDVEVVRGLVEHDDMRLLRDGAREHDALALAVGNLHEVAVAQIPHVHHVHGLAHLRAVFVREDAQAPRVGVPPGFHDVGAREKLGAHALGQHDRKLERQLVRRELADRLARDVHGAAERVEVTHDALEDSRLAGAVRADERKYLASVQLYVHVVYERHAIVSDDEVFRLEVNRPAAFLHARYHLLVFHRSPCLS